MAYAQIHTAALRHWKVAGLSDAAFRLWVSGLAYCQEHLTDGLIHRRVLPTLCPRLTGKAIDELLAVSLWHAAEDGWTVHDYLDWNASRDAVEAKRARWRGKKAGKAQETHTRPARVSTGESPVDSMGDSTGDSPVPIRYDTIRYEKSKSVPRAREASAPAGAGSRTDPTPRPVDLTGPPKVIAAWCDGYEAATQQPAMLRPGKADQDARLVADWLTRADAWPSLDALVRLFLAAPEFAGKRQLGMFAANLPQLAAWLTEHGPDVPYGDEDARFRAERARELAKLTAQAAQDAPRTTIGRAEASQVVRRLETVLRPAGGR